MPYYASNEITGATAAAALTGQQPFRRPLVASQQAGDVESVQATIIFASGVNLVINDVIELAVLPADHIIVDWKLLNDDFDSAASLTIRMGLMTGTPADAGRAFATVGQELIAAGATTLQAPAITAGAAVASIAGYRIAPSSADRSIGLGIVAAPTNPATIRQLDFIFMYRAARFGG